MPVSSAEVTGSAKLLENIYRAVNIARVNELKIVLGALDADVWEVVEAASTKPDVDNVRNRPTTHRTRLGRRRSRYRRPQQAIQLWQHVVPRTVTDFLPKTSRRRQRRSF